METLHISRQPNGGLAVMPNKDGIFQVWERPRPRCRYLVSVRGGGKAKLVGGKRDRERSVAMVFRKYVDEEAGEAITRIPTRLVARLVPPANLDPTPLAEIAAILAEWYGDAIAFVEVKDGPIVAKECQRLGVSVQIREVLDKSTNVWSKDIGWLTDSETGPAAYNALVNASREAFVGGPGRVLIECPHALAELATFAPDEDDAPLITHDDDVRAMATALYNIESASFYHPETRARQAPRDGWKMCEEFS